VVSGSPAAFPYNRLVDHADHVSLLRGGVASPGGVWADFGAGRGAFTLALADLLVETGELFAIDRDRAALAANEEAIRARFPGVPIHCVVADFTRPIVLPRLNGIAIANALHFQRDLRLVLRLLRGYLAPEGRLVVVEYNIRNGNPAVPYPIPFEALGTLAVGAGFQRATLLARRPSRTFAEMYSAVLE